jgi:hypothetical protein
MQLLDAERLDSITVSEAADFIGPDGDLAIIQPGIYHVDSEASTLLRLVSPETKTVQFIQARATHHRDQISEPVALSVLSDDGKFHLVLLFPDGKGLEAVGSLRAELTRGIADLLSATQLHDVLLKKKAELGTRQR